MTKSQLVNAAEYSAERLAAMLRIDGVFNKNEIDLSSVGHFEGWVACAKWIRAQAEVLAVKPEINSAVILEPLIEIRKLKELCER